MRTPRSLKRSLLLFPGQMATGGMPDGCRNFILIAVRVLRREVFLQVEGAPVDKEGLLGDFDVKIDIDDKGSRGAFYRGGSNSNFVVFFKLSRLATVAWGRRLQKKGCHYSVMLAWQINEFLDWNRLFSKSAILTVESAERAPPGFKAEAGDGVVEDNVTICSCVMAVKRKLYLASLGRNLHHKYSVIYFFRDMSEALALKQRDIYHASPIYAFLAKSKKV